MTEYKTKTDAASALPENGGPAVDNTRKVNKLRDNVLSAIACAFVVAYTYLPCLI